MADVSWWYFFSKIIDLADTVRAIETEGQNVWIDQRFFFSFRFSSSCVRKTTRWLSSTSTITARWSSTGGSVLNTHLVANVSRFPTKKNKQESSDNLMFESIQSILTDKSLVPVTFYSSNLNNFITTSFEMLVKLLYLVGTIPIWLIGRLVKNFVI